MGKGQLAIRALLLVLFLGIAFSSKGADEKGNYAIMGVGTLTCQEFTTALKNKNQTVMDLVNWLSGYMTAYNLLTKKTNNIVSAMPTETQLDWLEKYCATFPKEDFSTATQALTIFLYPRRIVETPTDL